MEVTEGSVAVFDGRRQEEEGQLTAKLDDNGRIDGCESAQLSHNALDVLPVSTCVCGEADLEIVVLGGVTCP